MATWTYSSGLLLRIHHVTGMLLCAGMQLRMATWMCSSGLVLRTRHALKIMYIMIQIYMMMRIIDIQMISFISFFLETNPAMAYEFMEPVVVTLREMSIL